MLCLGPRKKRLRKTVTPRLTGQGSRCCLRLETDIVVVVVVVCYWIVGGCYC